MDDDKVNCPLEIVANHFCSLLQVCHLSWAQPGTYRADRIYRRH